MIDDDFEIPGGVAYPWIFVQKRIIFSNKIEMVEAFSKYHKVFVRNKENDSLLQDCIMTMRQLYAEVKETIRKNPKCKKEAKESIYYLDKLIEDIRRDFTSEDFPELYKHHIKLLDMLVYIKLTDIEAKIEDPGQAIKTTRG